LAEASRRFEHLALTYEDGRLVRAATRGDGTNGEEVTANAQFIAPFRCRCAIRRCGQEVPAGRIEIRGEAYLRVPLNA
jgi:DNA ligase (NAD+)